MAHTGRLAARRDCNIDGLCCSVSRCKDYDQVTAELDGEAATEGIIAVTPRSGIPIGLYLNQVCMRVFTMTHVVETEPACQEVGPQISQLCIIFEFSSAMCDAMQHSALCTTRAVIADTVLLWMHQVNIS